ncbi:MAG: hypothetical protein FWF58_04950 [Firmicutes bacterium]|nr:hypothetical protein [Bacillota bacterium]
MYQEEYYKELERPTRPSAVPPLPNPPLSPSPILSAITEALKDSNLFANFSCVENDGLYTLMDLYGKIAIPHQYLKIQIVQDTILVQNLNNSYEIFLTNENTISLVATNVELYNLQIIDSHYFKSSVELHILKDIVLGNYLPLGTNDLSVVDILGYDMYLVQDDNSKLGIVDKNFKIIATPQFVNVLKFVDEYTIAVKAIENKFEYYSLDIYGNIFPLPYYDGYTPQSTSHGIFWYSRFGSNNQVLLYDINKTIIQKDELILTSSHPILFGRTFLDLYIVQFEDTILVYKFGETQPIATFDTLNFILHKNNVYFIANNDDNLSLIDIKLQPIAKDVDKIEYDYNVLLQKGNVSQVFRFI